MLRRGAGAPAVQKLAGHANLETTAIYAHCVEGDLHDAIGRLEEPTEKSSVGQIGEEEEEEPMAAE